MSTLAVRSEALHRTAITDEVDGAVARHESGTPWSAPLIERRDHEHPSVFRPENMLREARRQKGLAPAHVPPVCVLDPDGDIVRYVRAARRAGRSPAWACYHTEMWQWESEGDDGLARFGVVGCAVGASFAVLVAEQLFVSGCELLISIASAGQILASGPPPYYVLVERALRDEGTSYHYLPASPFVEADADLLALAARAFSGLGCRVRSGASWTTDAPFRETAAAIEARRRQGILTVEMEAAALLAFGRATGKPVLCLAHVTNQLGCVEGDFDKGETGGAASSLGLVAAVAREWRKTKP
jgi:uridine phosphorylase